MILFLNGAFGIGKTTVARALVHRLPRAVLFDPEWIGIALQRFRRVDDFRISRRGGVSRSSACGSRACSAAT